MCCVSDKKDGSEGKSSVLGEKTCQKVAKNETSAIPGYCTASNASID